MDTQPKNVSEIKLRVAVAGGPGVGKSTLAAELFVKLKKLEFDFDLLPEATRLFKKRIGTFTSVMDRAKVWAMQDEFEMNSTAVEGFITCTPVFSIFASAKFFNTGMYQGNLKTAEERECLNTLEAKALESIRNGRYGMVVLVANPWARFGYVNNPSRKSRDVDAEMRNDLIVELVSDNCKGSGSTVLLIDAERQRPFDFAYVQIRKKLAEIRNLRRTLAKAAANAATLPLRSGEQNVQESGCNIEKKKLRSGST